MLNADPPCEYGAMVRRWKPAMLVPASRPPQKLLVSGWWTIPLTGCQSPAIASRLGGDPAGPAAQAVGVRPGSRSDASRASPTAALLCRNVRRFNSGIGSLLVIDGLWWGSVQASPARLAGLPGVSVVVA